MMVILRFFGLQSSKLISIAILEVGEDIAAISAGKFSGKEPVFFPTLCFPAAVDKVLLT